GAVRPVPVIVYRELEGIGRLYGGCEQPAPPLVLHVIVTAGDVGIVEQDVAAHSKARADHLVDINRRAHRLVGSEHRRDIEEVVLVVGLLGDDIDRAAGDTAPTDGAAGPLVDLHLIDGEGLTRGISGIAKAVDEDIAARIEAADVDRVAERVTTLGKAKHDTR